MNDLKSAVISLVFSVIAIGLCELLIPKDNFKNQIRLITGCVLIICMISPFLNGFNFDKIDLSQGFTDIEVDRKVEKAIVYSVKSDIVDVLRENNIHDAIIKINTDFDENNSIIIKSVIILFDYKDKSKYQHISGIVEKRLGFKVEVGERIND